MSMAPETEDEPRNPFASMDRWAKFDIQLAAAVVRERRLAEIFHTSQIERIELKSESWQWEQTGNIAVEYRRKGQPSGISITQADFWVHELLRDGETLVYLMFPIERLKQMARAAIRAGRHRRGGDGNEFDVALISLRDILQ